MKLLIISDIHDNLPNLDKCLDWAFSHKAKAMLCCGDVTNSDTLRHLAQKFKGSVYIVRGNAEIFDRSELKQYANIADGGKIGRWSIADLTIGACHEPYLIDKVREKGSCDFIFYGHTHEPWIEKRGNTVVANPGTLSGMFSRATFAVLYTETRELRLERVEEI